MPDRVWLNGRMTPPEEATISIEDRGFLYGDALFETMRAYGGVVFRLDAHLERLRAGAEFLGFAGAPTDDDLSAAVADTLTASGYGDAYLRLTVTRGVGRGLTHQPEGGPTVLIEARELHLYDERLYREGARLIVSKVGRGTSASLAERKLTNYLLAIMAKREAAAADADDALHLSADGCVAEASVSNLFIVRDGDVLTPPVDDGVLPGITRGVVMVLCADADRRCAEQSLQISDVLAADEAFLTNTLMEVMPVRSVGSTHIGGSVPGPVTADLAVRYKKLVVQECRG